MAGNPYWDKLVLGLHCDGTNGSTTFTDVKGKTVTANGNAQISTAQYPALTGKTSSAYFDGTGDYLSVPDSAAWDFGSADFSVRCLVRFGSLAAAYQALVSQYQNSTTGWAVQYSNSGTTLRFYYAGDTAATFSWSPSINTWYEIEISRSGSSLRAFVDGTQIGTTVTNSTNITGSTSTLKIGSIEGTLNYLTGYISEVAIYKGVAIHTANYTPSSDPFGDGYLPAGSGIVSAIGNVPYFSYGATSRPVIFVNA